MKFDNLLSRQDKDLEQSLINLYQHAHRSVYWNDRQILNFSATQINKYFQELDEQTREKYLDTIKKDYVLTREEFENRFVNKGRDLIKRGFYLWSEEQKYFIPPNEFIDVLAENSLIWILINCAKADLVKSFKEKKVAQLPKCKLLQNILSESFQRYSVDELSKAELDQISEQLQAFQPVLKNHHGEESTYENWAEVAKTLGVKVRSDDSWRFATNNLEDYLKALDHLIAPLLESQICFLKKRDSCRASLIMNPLLNEKLARRLIELTTEQYEKAKHSLKPLPKVTISLEYKEFFHISPEQLLRIAIILLAWIDSGKIGFTQQNIPKVTDLRRLAKIIVPDSGQQEFYLNLLEYIYQQLASPEALKRLDTRTELRDLWSSLSKLPSETLIVLLHKQKNEIFDDFFLPFLSSLPKEEWIEIKDAKHLFGLYYCSKEGELRKRHMVDKWFQQFLFLAKIFGKIDVITNKKVEKKADFFKTLAALRTVPCSVSNKITQDSSQLHIQGNLEIPIPVDIDQNLLFSAAKLFDLSDINTLKFTREAVIKMATSGYSLDQVSTSLEKLLSNELPLLGKKILTQIFKERIKVFFDGNCLYLYDSSAFEQVKSLIPDERTVEIIDNRLFILNHSPKAVIISRLEKNNIIVERGVWLR